jgi:type IV pilus assembly protein PilV
MIRSRKNHASRPGRNKGFSLVEVLVTIVILLIGLLGLAGLQGRALNAQMESYQRSQALILLKDMVDRIDANRANAAAYVTTGLATPYLGTGNAADANCSAKATWQLRDSCEWNNALLGAAETLGGNKVGAMIGARGCVYQIVAPAAGVPAEYLVAVAWQGLNSTAAPAILCGQGLYSGEALRRVVALPISLADL